MFIRGGSTTLSEVIILLCLATGAACVRLMATSNNDKSGLTEMMERLTAVRTQLECLVHCRSEGAPIGQYGAAICIHTRCTSPQNQQLSPDDDWQLNQNNKPGFFQEQSSRQSINQGLDNQHDIHALLMSSMRANPSPSGSSSSHHHSSHHYSPIKPKASHNKKSSQSSSNRVTSSLSSLLGAKVSKRWQYSDPLQVCTNRHCQGLERVQFYQCVFRKCIAEEEEEERR